MLTGMTQAAFLYDVGMTSEKVKLLDSRAQPYFGYYFIFDGGVSLCTWVRVLLEAGGNRVPWSCSYKQLQML